MADTSKVVALPGFTEAAKHTAVTRGNRLVVNVEGQEKKGKTSFALSAPGPIALFDLDTGLERVVDKWVSRKKILIASYNYRDATSEVERAEVMGRFMKNYYDALKSPVIKSLIIDTATELWELMRMVKFGKLSEVKPHHYGPVNAEFRDLIRKAYDTDKNLLLVHKLKNEYINDKRTGGYERAGFGDIPYIVQVNLRVFRDEDGFGLTVTDCRPNEAMAGMELREPMNTFPYLAAEAFGTGVEEWE